MKSNQNWKQTYAVTNACSTTTHIPSHIQAILPTTSHASCGVNYSPKQHKRGLRVFSTGTNREWETLCVEERCRKDRWMQSSTPVVLLSISPLLLPLPLFFSLSNTSKCARSQRAAPKRIDRFVISVDWGLTLWDLFSFCPITAAWPSSRAFYGLISPSKRSNKNRWQEASERSSRLPNFLARCS